MSKKKKNPEIDVFELLKIIWKGKWKIILFTVLLVSLAINYKSKQNIIYTGKTEIQPISIFEEFSYNTLNSFILNRRDLNSEDNLNSEDISLDYNQIDKSKQIKKPVNDILDIQIKKSYLLNLFVDKLGDEKFLVSLIKKLNIIDKKNYEDTILYENDIGSLVNSIEVIPKNNSSLTFDDNWFIKVQFHNKEIINHFFKILENSVSEEVRLYVEQVLEKLVKDQKNLVTYMIEDIDQMILNEIELYDKKISNRLAFLDEQAQIARKLNISKNNLIESQTFKTDTGIITSLRTEIPYYMRGYEMIEKEIELINDRKDKKLFINTLSNLEKRKKIWITNKDTERFVDLIANTPISRAENFKAAKINLNKITYENNAYSLNKLLILAFLSGFLLSVIYLLIESFIKSHKKSLF